MNKNYYILIAFIVVFSLPVLVKSDTSTNIPVDQVGIAAYVKVDNINNVNINTIGNAFHSIEASGESYIIGTIEIQNEVNPSYPHLYIGLDGWLVAYYLKTEETSRIMQWKNYVAGSITTNTLKDAIDYISGQAGLTYSTPLKYYDFEFPEANKLTLIADSNDFYVTVPGTLYEASYGVLLKNSCCSGSACRVLKLKIDENLVYESSGLGCWWTCSFPFSVYNYYDLPTFQTGITHHIVFQNGCSDWSPNSSSVTVLIYKN